MKHTKLFLTALLATLGWTLTMAQQNESAERKQLFDTNWKFSLGDNATTSQSMFDDSQWRTLDLPHDWSIEGKTELTNPMKGAGGYFPAGIGWYRKTFTTPTAWQGKHVSVYFEGVYMNAEVFINGKSLGVHPYGYTSFCYDLTPFLLIGKKNTIAVRVDNSQQINCRWYSGSGIYRHVWMQVTEPVHVAHWGVSITTPEVSANKATVQVKTVLKNETNQLRNIILSTELSSNTNKNAGNNQVKVELPANAEKEIVQTIEVQKPALWTPETPALYKARIHILQDKKTLDVVENTFGIRSLKFTAEKGFELNGKAIKINGGCVHHDNGCLGAAAFDRAEERRVELLKAAGFNAIRTSHNPPSEAFLNACDRLGLMVIDEAFDGWRTEKNKHDYAGIFDQWSQRDIEAMVRRDQNHPSIIMWSIGNEIIERKKPEAVETARKLSGYVKNIDTTRPVTSAMTTWDKDWEIFDSLMAAHDIGGYNYQMHHAEADHQRVPSRIILQTESYPRDAFSNWNMVQNHDYIIGDVVWTALDYLGESGIGRWFYPGEPKGEHWESELYPWHGAYCGDIDLTGWRKPISHYRNLLWNDTEKLYLAVKEPNPDNGKISETLWSVWPTWESWTWPGREGKDIEVEVYSKYPSVRLYLNDKLIGEKQTSKEQEFKAVFTLLYTAGTIKAVGVKERKELESKLLKTAGNATQLKVTADRTKLTADGQDLSFVTVEVLDKEGNLQPNAENRLQFKVSGPGIIAAVDNANLRDTDVYTDASRKAWNGRAMVVIRTKHKAGDIKLDVSGVGLKATSVVLKASK